MQRLILFVILLLTACAAPSTIKKGDYFGRLKQGQNSFRLYLQLENKKTDLTLIGFRGYPIPLQKVTLRKDSLIFWRADTFSGFKGSYVASSGNITGQWISEDSASYPLTFFPAVADTIKGLNPRTIKDYRYEAPPKMNDQIETGNRKDQQMNVVLLDSLVSEIMKKKFEYVHSLLIARNNQLVVEEYFYGYPREAHFGIQSATKSFVSALTGIAIEKKEIEGVETELHNYLPQYRNLLYSEQNKTINLRDLLSMSTGLEWDEITYEYGHKKNSSMIAANTQDEFRYLFTRSRSKEKVFAYNSLSHILMNHVLKESTQLDNSTEMKTRLLEPLGITEYDLGEANNGVLGDIFLRPRDMLKFG